MIPRSASFCATGRAARPRSNATVGARASALFGAAFAGFALFWMAMAAQAGGVFWMFGLIHFGVGVGLIYSVKIDQANARVDITMTLTAPGCGMGPVLVGDVEYRVAQVPNVRKVEVELVFDPPWHREMMSEEAQLETGMFY